MEDREHNENEDVNQPEYSLPINEKVQSSQEQLNLLIRVKYEEEKQVPHYISYWEQLLSNNITVIANISGVIISQKEKDKIWARRGEIKMSKMELMSYPLLDINKFLEKLALSVAKTEFLSKTIERLENLIYKLTRKIEDEARPERRITPKMRWSAHEKELFWSCDYSFLSLKEEVNQENLQCLEIERWHLQCLQDFHDQLVTQQTQEQIRKRKNGLERLLESSETEGYLSNKLEYEELDHSKLPIENDINNRTVEENFVSVKSLEDYLTDDGKKLLPVLKSKFKPYKPKRTALLLYALYDLDLLLVHPENNITEIFNAMSNTFSAIDIGTRQGLAKAISNLNEANEKDRELIENVKIKIYKELIAL